MAHSLVVPQYVESLWVKSICIAVVNQHPLPSHCYLEHHTAPIQREAGVCAALEQLMHFRRFGNQSEVQQRVLHTHSVQLCHVSFCHRSPVEAGVSALRKVKEGRDCLRSGGIVVGAAENCGFSI